MTIYKILTRDGKADAGQPLQELVSDISGGGNVLVHLHGGLVNQQAGLETADRLARTWQLGDDWTQLYVVWRTGPLETLQTNWPDLVHDDRLYQTILRKLIGFVARKLGLPQLEGRSAGAQFGLTDDEIQRRITGKSDTRQPFNDVETEIGTQPIVRGRAILDETQSNGALAREFQSELATDAAFNDAVADIDAAIAPAATGRGGLPGTDPQSGQKSFEHLSSVVRGELTGASAQVGGRGLLSVGGFLLEHAGKIALRCFKRFRTGRDHGLHATIVEELCREMYGDLIGAKIWGMMVQDAADHFAPEGFGTALLPALKAPRAKPIVVTAHSAGSIWASRMLLAMQSAAAATRVNLIFLAPAVRESLFAETLDSAEPLIERCHMFTMYDELEGRDAVLGHDKGYIYPSSLLYLVSGLFEERASAAYPDAPLLGMQRFGVEPWLEKDEASAASAIATFFQRPENGIAHSITKGVTESDSHGGFDDDATTLKSVRALFGMT